MRTSRPDDIPALTDLWQLCFGDSAEAVQDFFAALWEKVTVFQTEDASAMLTAMPVSWQGKQAAYLYAVATHPDQRGKGLCRKLMAFAEEALKSRGCSYAILSPAEESLFRFYENMGYETCFFAETQKFSTGECAETAVSVPAEQYRLLRENRMPEGVQYPIELLRMQESFGLFLQIGDTGCAAVERHGDGFLVRELLADDPAAAAAAVCRFCNVPQIACKLPGSAPYGMAKSLDGSPLTDSWLGLAFE